jgi:hypothetical protein
VGALNGWALALVTGGLVLSRAGAASAHFDLVLPPPADKATDGGKGAPPCGPLAPASNVVTAIQGGHPLKVEVMETVGHNGFYRIALSTNSRSELPVDNVVYDASGKVLPPSGKPSGQSTMHADFENPPVFPVLADNQWNHMAGLGADVFQADIMIPNITCTKCTLQVIEFMWPHGFNADTTYPPGGGYFYHHCADLKITADPALPLYGAGDGGAPDATADGSATKDVAAETGAPGSGGAGVGGAMGSGGAGGSGNNGSGGTTGTGGAVTGGNGTGGATTGTAGKGGVATSSGGCGIAGGAGLGGEIGALGAISLLAAFAFRARRRGRI